MSGRYQQAGQLDEVSYGDNDKNFMGVNMRADPMSLTEGICAKAVNMQFRQGVAEPRHGFHSMAWGRQGGIDFPWTFPISFVKQLGFGKVYGATTFADPVGYERQILACATKSWSITPNAPPSVIFYPPGVEVDGPVRFTQAFNVLLMWRGAAANPLKLETRLDFTFPQIWEEVPDETNEDYTSTIPDAASGLHYGNRVWVPFGDSEVAYSDILSYTRYDAVLSTIWVNEGDSNVLLKLAAYGVNSIVAFKSNSIYYLAGVLPDPSISARVQVLTTQRGLVAPDSVAQVGRDLWFLSDDGVYAIGQVLENALQAGAEPVSAPMDPLIQRISWGDAARAQGIYHDGRYYLAVPIDGAHYNNIILVYDLVNKQWAGWWEGPFMDVGFFLRIDIQGHRRLAFVAGDSIARNEGRLYVMMDGYTDESFDGECDIATELITRGYPAGVPIDKQFLSGGLELLTWNGAGSIDVIRDGVNEEMRVLDFQKDRLKYNLFAKRAYDPGNAADDFLAPYRQDYSLQLLPEPGIDLGTGVVLGYHQASSERFRIRHDTRFVQLRLRGTRGRCKLRAASLLAHADFVPLRSTI